MPRALQLIVGGRKIGLTEKFRFTTILIGLAAVMLALEFFNMQSRSKSYLACKQAPPIRPGHLACDSLRICS